ncbi:hypothetical protein NQ317_014684 [Molorchus minor]|uniref:GOST seven transmembrane domain-containing protein n=1 Tax=Molorchus minor TaxID=1323400 RepID=A0ABQ9JHX8_9CUCU|nr:hypothetical protein NQ317_014684 [Molorchus minor]
MNPYLDGHQERCILDTDVNLNNDEIYFKMDLVNQKLKVMCKETQIIHIYKDNDDATKRMAVTPCGELNFDITSTVKADGHTYYNTSFFMSVETVQEEGLYNLFFHSCPNYNPNTETVVDFSIEMVEWNPSSYLSAGDIPLPALYCMMSILFLLLISLAFHGVNYHYIEIKGKHLLTWAILFYVAHLLKGALLFLVLVLTGTGWTFIKNVLTQRDKKVFMVVIPLQVLANVAEIILEESEEGAREYAAWKNFVILVDLLCCACILFPVLNIHLGSVRDGRKGSHEPEKTETRQALLHNDRLLYILDQDHSVPAEDHSALPVQLVARDVQARWRHTSSSYLQLTSSVRRRRILITPSATRRTMWMKFCCSCRITESGATEGLKKVNSRITKVPLHQQTLTEVTEEEGDALLGKESSHEYD